VTTLYKQLEQAMVNFGNLFY